MAGLQLGSFLGAASNSGLNTFLQIAQYKRQQDQLNREQQDRDTQKAAFSKVGQNDYTQGIQNVSDLTPEQAKVINDWAQQQAGGDAGLQQQLVQQRVGDSANGLDPINAAGLRPQTYTQAQAYHDIAGKLNDPKMGMQYQQMGTQLDKEAQLKALFGASDQMFGGDLQGGLSTIASLHNSSVQNGYTSSVQNDPVTGKPMYVLTNAATGQQQRFDPTTPLAQNALVMRAAAAIDPEKYAPLAQHAVNLWATSGLQGQQQADTAQHNANSEAIQANTSNNSGLTAQSEAAYRDRMAGVAEKNAGTQAAYKDAVVRQYDQGLRGGRGAAVDPAKVEREKRAEQAAFIKENPNLYSVQADPEGKPMPHPGMLALTNNMLKTTDAATTQQTMLAIQAQASQAATDPNTGRLDYGKYIAALNAITAQATAALAARTGAGVKPGNTAGSGGGVAPKDPPYPKTSQAVQDGMRREDAKQKKAAGLKSAIKGAAQSYADAYEQNPYGMTY